MVKRILSLCLAMSMLVAAVTTVFAAGPATSVVSGCDVERRGAAAIVETAGSGTVSLPLPDPVPYHTPVGEPADAATVERVFDLVHTMAGCVNGDDLLGFMSLLSDEFLRRHFGEFGMTAEDLAGYSPAPLPVDQWVSVAAIDDATLLPDGRIAVLVILDQTGWDIPELTSVLTLVEQRGMLNIDEWQPVTLRIEEAWDSIEGNGYAGWIVPTELAADDHYWLTGARAQATWTPTPAQIARPEAHLPGVRQSEPRSAPDLADRVAGYYRHYAGIVADGHKLILVNVFRPEAGDEESTAPLIVLDGGDCDFHLTDKPSTGVFSDRSINGEA